MWHHVVWYICTDVSEEHVASKNNADQHNTIGFYFEMWFFVVFWYLWRVRFKAFCDVAPYILVRIYQQRKKCSGSNFKVETRFSIFLRNIVNYQVAWRHASVTCHLNPYPTAFPYGNGMVLHFYQQQESSTTKTVHKVINKGLKTYV